VHYSEAYRTGNGHIPYSQSVPANEREACGTVKFLDCKEVGAETNVKLFRYLKVSTNPNTGKAF
jgi:hypothetical protein